MGPDIFVNPFTPLRLTKIRNYPNKVWKNSSNQRKSNFRFTIQATTIRLPKFLWNI